MLLCGLAVLPAPAQAAQSPPGSGIRMIDLPSDEGVELAVEYSNRAAVTLTITVTGVNAAPDRPMPIVVTCPEKGTFPFVRLKPIHGDQSFSWRVKYDWRHGQAGVRHNDRIGYELPYPKGRSFLVGQGFHGSFTHSGNDAYAVDFDMPEGTPVLAARAGTVDVVVDHFDGGGVDPGFRDQANHVLVRHSDGTYAEYVHLRRNGARVRPGQKVKAREAIAWSGNVGYSRGPHLHFAVFRAINGTDRETFPIQFRTLESGACKPVEGDRYTAP